VDFVSFPVLVLRTLVVAGLKARGSPVFLETHLNRFSLNALLEIWYLGAYDNLDPGPGGTVIDLGANVGDFTLKASRWVGDKGVVIAVEPVREHLVVLKRNLDRNRISNVTIVEKAIGESNGHIHVDGQEFETTSIDEIVAELGLTHVNSIKVDIEGAELLAMHEGLRTIKRAKHISAETHSHSLFRDVTSLLESEGYHVYCPSLSMLTARMSRRILRNPGPFLLTEAARTRSWSSAGPPFLMSIQKWLLGKHKPDWFSQSSGLALLCADHN